MFQILRRVKTLRKSNTAQRQTRKPSFETLEDRSLLSVITLGFDTLPSSQGWTYISGNRPESDVFSVDGTTLTMNSMGTGIRPARAYHYYEYYDAIDPSRPFTISATLRVLESEGFDSNFNLLAETGTYAFGIGIGTREIRRVYPGNALLSTGDYRTEHQFRLDVSPTTGFQFHVNGDLVGSGPWGPGTVSNRIQFGDGTMDGNSQVKITRYEFRQEATDIVASELTWNTAQAGVDFRYNVAGAALTADTTAALYWARGTHFADVIDPEHPVYSTTIERAVGDYGPFHVSASDLGAPPQGATHLLLAIDPPSPGHPHGLIEESDEGNNVVSVSCPVEELSTKHQDPPGYDISLLVPELQAAILRFESLVGAVKGTTFDPTSGFRPTVYQAHLYELLTKFLELSQLPGMVREVVGGRPQLRTTPDTLCMLCTARVNTVNNEIVLHLLTPNRRDGAPAVCRPGWSDHEHGRAVDITITGLTSDQKRQLARAAGLRGPLSERDPHYKLLADDPRPCVPGGAPGALSQRGSERDVFDGLRVVEFLADSTVVTTEHSFAQSELHAIRYVHLPHPVSPYGSDFAHRALYRTSDQSSLSDAALARAVHPHNGRPLIVLDGIDAAFVLCDQDRFGLQ